MREGVSESEWVDMLLTQPHPNDTLCGALFAYERPEDKPHRGRVGYWRLVEERMIRAQLEKEGWESDWKDGRLIYFEISNRIAQNHRNDVTFREQQELLRKYRPAKPGSVAFTEEEFERLAEHFAGANDPVSQSILIKALDAIKASQS